MRDMYFSCSKEVSDLLLQQSLDYLGKYINENNLKYWKRDTKYDPKLLKGIDVLVFYDQTKILGRSTYSAIKLADLTRGVRSEIRRACDSGCGIYTYSLGNLYAVHVNDDTDTITLDNSFGMTESSHLHRFEKDMGIAMIKYLNGHTVRIRDLDKHKYHRGPVGWSHLMKHLSGKKGIIERRVTCMGDVYYDVLVEGETETWSIYEEDLRLLAGLEVLSPSDLDTSNEISSPDLWSAKNYFK